MRVFREDEGRDEGWDEGRVDEQKKSSLTMLRSFVTTTTRPIETMIVLRQGLVEVGDESGKV